ncbi:MAG: glycine-rich protein, partial [Salibacteraceae bacterium]|nr:glycine-rich protein [Salibacteraceae bacterium]
MKTNTINLINRLRKGALVLISIAGFSSLAWSQASYTFATGGATGQFGPTQAQINTAYSASNLSGSVVVVNGIQYWVVPTSGAYSIEAYGAQGFGSFGGRGAKMYGEFQLNGGDTLKIIVGQRGAPPVGSGTNQYGGGGGSI